MHAFWEELRPGLGLIRVGPNCRGPGDAFDLALVAHHQSPHPIELKGMSSAFGFSQAHHDAIGCCLLQRGYRSWQRRRYKSGVLVPPMARAIQLSKTHLKEIRMSVELAHEANVSAWEKAITAEGDEHLSALAQHVLDEMKQLHAARGSLHTVETKLTAAIPLAKALDALQAYGLPLDQETEQQVHIRHAIHGLLETLKHVGNEMVTPTNMVPAAV